LSNTSILPARVAAAQSHRGLPQAAAALVASVLAFFVITLDATVVNVALPSVRADLAGGLTGLQWVVDGYTLMFAALLLSAGALVDRLGARDALGVGVGVFVLASLACAMAPDMAVLVAARFVQGLGAAVTMPASMALVRHAYDDPARRAYGVGVWAMGEPSPRPLGLCSAVCSAWSAGGSSSSSTCRLVW
jgi:MFS transporter, DHA2 family, methylenomycin A resistance protein